MKNSEEKPQKRPRLKPFSRRSHITWIRHEIKYLNHWIRYDVKPSGAKVRVVWFNKAGRGIPAKTIEEAKRAIKWDR